MKFEWDEQKNKFNLQKHGLTFEEAKEIFKEIVLTREDDRYDYGEERLISLGSLAGIAILVVVHVDRNDKTRIISARRANRTERKIYDNDLKKTVERD